MNTFLFTFLEKFLPIQTVYAHCDVPCGIYDPHLAQVAAHTVIRMTNLISETKDDFHKLSRMIHIKEEQGELVEEELGTLENDYFKEEHFKENPSLRETIAKAVKLSITVRQEVNIEAAQELLVQVQKVAEIFWKTKGLSTVRLPAPYPSGGEIVLPKS